jgi:chromosome segregation protein
MLKLHALRLSGFKSFVDPTSLRFAQALTAVVGPNGCGKSNLADAVIWALGERSAKSLRGDTMEDVIFAGAEGRKPLGMAEVTLELATNAEFPHADDGRLTITRRVFRTGESEYFLNGKRVRLRDVRTLLMDTGLGLRGYSMIEQGQIGMILSGKPQERRRLLEEAAGITHYKDRRRIAEVKLEETRGNLARLDDILSEVERSTRALKRQASAARRYREQQLELARLLQAVLHGRWARLAVAAADVSKRLEAELARDAESSAALARDEAAYVAAREAAERLGQELEEAHRAEGRLVASIEGRQEFLKGARARGQELAERLASGRRVAEDGRARQRALAAELAALEARSAEIASERQRAAAAFDADSASLDKAAQWAAEAAARLEGLRASLLASLNGLTELRNRQHAEHLEAEKGELRRRHLAAERHAREERRAEAETAWAEASGQAERLAAQRDACEAALDELRQGLAAVALRRAELEEARLEQAGEQAALGQREAWLQELAAARGDRLRRLEAALAEAGVAEAAFLSTRLRAPEGWAAGLDLFLGELADAAVLARDDDPIGLAAALAGRVPRAILLRPLGSGAARPAVVDPAILSGLGEALGLPEELAAALPPACLVASAADAERLARLHPHVAFLTRDGLWAQAGTIHLQGSAQPPGLLAATEELARLATDLPTARARLEATEADLASVASEIRDLESALAERQATTAEARQSLAVVEARREDLGAARRRLAVELETVATELGEVERELAAIASRQALLAGDLARAEARHADFERAFDAAQAELDRSLREREATSTSGASRRGLLDLLDERLDSLAAERARISTESSAEGGRLAAWASEEADLEARRRDLEASVGAAESQLRTDLEARDGTAGRLAEAQDDLQARRRGLDELEQRIAATRRDREAIRERLAGLREERASLRQDVEHLAGEIRRDLQAEPPSGPGEGPPANLPELEADLERCRRTLERLGPVNLLAADEYAEQEERLRFLTTQRADIAGSLERLRTTIRELNEESSGRFLATFTEVNESFGRTFTDLFRGGSAEMRLMDETDPLDGGIEIVARPPGKRLQNLSLLSGGEKALTAIALLFALFRTKPSPFCILDEVDAPLDDVNTLRFVDLLRGMASETQFMVITHNKLTMEAASTLYGVTMQERGVSHLVAVELDSLQAAEASEPAASAALPA